MSAIFVTGTDTGVGKTLVSTAIVAAATAAGHRIAVLKPAESGCRREAGSLVPEDGRRLWTAAGRWQPWDTVVPYRFEPAVAPGVAADEEGVVLDFDALREQVTAMRRQAAGLVVEGAGGLLVPVGRGRLVADLIRALGLDVLVVGRSGLGTINHTLLTLEALERRGLRCTGFVLNDADGDVAREFALQNASEIEAASGMAFRGLVGHVDDVDDIAALAAVSPDLTWLGLG